MDADSFNVKLTWREPAQPADLPPLFFIHGAWHGAWCWDAFAAFFTARGYPCALIDLAGHGDLPPPPGYNVRPLSRHLPSLRAAISEVARRGRPVLIAHSMGGWLAQMLLCGPDAVDVRGAVLVTPVPARGLPIGTTLKVARQHPVKFLLATFLRPFSVDNPGMARKLFHEPDKPENEVAASTAKLRPESAMACIDMIFGLSRPNLGRMTRTPILLLSAEHDYFFPPRHELRNAERIGAEYLEFRGMAHNLMEDARWEEVAEAIGGWVARACAKAA